MSPPPEDPEALLSHDRFVRTLARSLLGDADRGEDLAQEAWLAHVRRPSRGLGPLRAWLAAIVRKLAARARRNEARRARHEQAAARHEELAPVSELVEREALRKRVIDAVLALDEPYRTAIVLRYFEELPPRKVAARLRVPVETVRTRIKRALDQLRSRLDDECQGGWKVAALPLCGLGPAGVVTSLAGVVFMTTKLKAWVAAAAIVLALAFGIWATFAVAPVDPAMHAREDVAAATARGATVDAPESPATLPIRTLIAPPLPATANATTGSLLARVTWADDQTPAVGVGADLVRFGPGSTIEERRMAQSDGAGHVRMAGLPPGKQTLYLDRDVSQRLEIEAGKETVVALEIPLGVHLRGTVVDHEGRGVGGAEVFACPGGSFEWTPVVARSAADGSFSARSLTPDVPVGASCPGHASSILQRASGAPGNGVSVRLILQEECVVAGRVVDGEGAPIADCAVLVGYERSHGVSREDGEWGQSPPPARMTTGPDGRFEARGVAAGPTLIAARARRFAPWQDNHVARTGGANEREIRLGPGATLAGKVTDVAGAPVPGVAIRVGEFRAFRSSVVVTAHDGSFRLEDLAPGEIAVRASTEDQGRASTTLTCRPGEEVRWDPVLAAGPAIRGRLLDEADQPLSGWSIAVEGKGGRTTDPQGRFELRDCKETDHELLVFAPGQGVFRAHSTVVRPGPQEVLVRVPATACLACTVLGSVVGGDGRALASVEVRLDGDGTGPRDSTFSAERTGAFRFGTLPPGSYRVTLSGRDQPTVEIPARTLAPGETWDLGTVRIETPGTLRMNISRDDGQPIGNCSLTVEGVTTRGRRGVLADPTKVTPMTLAAGRHTLRVHASGCAVEVVPFEIRAGEETVVDVTVRAGVSRAIRIVEATPSGQPFRPHVIVTDAAGKKVIDFATSPSTTSVVELAPTLRPGTYTVIATTADGRKADGSFTVPDGAGSTEPVELRVK